MGARDKHHPKEVIFKQRDESLKIVQGNRDAVNSTTGTKSIIDKPMNTHLLSTIRNMEP